MFLTEGLSHSLINKEIINIYNEECINLTGATFSSMGLQKAKGNQCNSVTLNFNIMDTSPCKNVFNLELYILNGVHNSSIQIHLITFM